MGGHLPCTVPTVSAQVTDITSDLAELIWKTSQAGESNISTTGANIIADAILVKFMVDVFPEPHSQSWFQLTEYQEYQAYKASIVGPMKQPDKII